MLDAHYSKLFLEMLEMGGNIQGHLQQEIRHETHCADLLFSQATPRGALQEWHILPSGWQAICAALMEVDTPPDSWQLSLHWRSLCGLASQGCR